MSSIERDREKVKLKRKLKIKCTNEQRKKKFTPMTKKGDLVLQRERQRISRNLIPYCPIMVNDNEPIALDRNS